MIPIGVNHQRPVMVAKSSRGSVSFISVRLHLMALRIDVNVVETRPREIIGIMDLVSVSER